MTHDYYGPHVGTERVLNEMLKLPAQGHEQDWEIELADPERVEEMLNAFPLVEPDIELKSALALLLIRSMEEAHRIGVLEEGQILRAAEVVQGNAILRERMRFHFSVLPEMADEPDLVRRIVGV